MPKDNPQATASRPKTSLALRGVLVIMATLGIGGLLFTVLTMRDDNRATGASSTEALAPPLSPETSTTADSQEELISRLEEILAVREEAYRKRAPELLKEIYTVDCPCLESDSNAIRELVREDYVWVGGETSIRVRRSERVSERMWIIIANFSSEPLQIQTKSGRTVRDEPRGSDLFQFVLAKPSGSTKWLLGRATSYKDG
jgi:hypothetical protein